MIQAWSPRLGAAVLLLASNLTLAAPAACSRPIQVPMAAMGFSAMETNGRPAGTYPGLFEQIGNPGRCEFKVSVVPRARLDQMFFARAEADILIPASRTPERDLVADFVPLIVVHPRIITLQSTTSVPRTVDEILASKTLRGVFVRGFTYGPQYQRLLEQLQLDGRAELVPALESVPKMILAQHADFTILAPTLFYSAMLQDPDYADKTRLVQATPLTDIPTVISGAYVSRKTLERDDIEAVRQVLQKAVRDGSVEAAFRRNYPPWVVESIGFRLP